MTYRVDIDETAARALARIDKKNQRRIARKIDDLASDPHPSGCTKLAGVDSLWRIRAGDYRIIYQVFAKRLVVVVVRIGNRKDCYRNLD